MARNVIFAGVGHHLPSKVVTSEEVERRVYETSSYKIPRGLVAKATGIVERRYRDDDEQASDLALKASRQALDRAGMVAEEIDLLIFASCMQDIGEPATANILQEKLGATRSHVFDVKNACNSFLNGLDVAESHILAGKANNALIAVGEPLSLTIDWNIGSTGDLRSRISALTLGDAGAAAVIRAEANENGRGILPSAFKTFGDQWRHATVLSGGSMYRLSKEHSYFRGNGHELRDQALKHVPDLVLKTFKKVGWSPDDVDLVCCHQVTMDLVDEIAELCGVPAEKCVVSIRDCGNTAAASIPLGLSRAWSQGRLRPGTKVLLVGGAAGFSVGVVPLVW
ncbi:MAG: ketoacyl-ACP synthase III [Phycisphaerae bacterium]